MTLFQHRDPALAAFWDERFAAGVTPWDAGAVPPGLRRFIETRAVPLGLRVLVPGCGSAYESALLDAAGFEVLAIDYAAAAIEAAHRALPPAVAQRVLRQADFFDFDAAPFDWIYERAFLPALPPRWWADWAARCAQLLRPGGVLAGFFVVEAAAPELRHGPPFAAGAAELTALLQPHFLRLDDQPIAAGESLPVFAGRERWQLWQRR
jgi:SAM-dependent methyltransferase